ncbi:MAG: hypothetical protein SP4CHLAM5_08530 [Chlamydiia bacterium]|nr:hypothetical protein [Chlamydiia bacterium]MCH9618716.1 hypothetical protein [Chlamydiia bacterium]MCH9624396.1 hypothetical protein [Chlamydiia bacterium]
MYYLLTLLTALAPVISATTPAEKAMSKQKNISNIHFGEKTGTILENLDNGRVIVLDDGSKWVVDPEDAPYSSGWLGPAPIVIRKDGPRSANFNYSMTNKWTKKTVRVRRWSATMEVHRSKQPFTQEEKKS